MTLTYGLAPQNAAKYAVEHWHYSGCLPAGLAVRVGVWEDGKFIGVVIFSRGASPFLARRYGLTQTEVCELTRVALREHKAPVSQIVAHALKHLKQTNPDLRIVVSFADPVQGHHGGIYQAGNWLYTGQSTETEMTVVHGKLKHIRSLGAKYGTTELKWIREHIDPKAHRYTVPGKHRYVMPLDKPTRRKLKPLALDYPEPGE